MIMSLYVCGGYSLDWNDTHSKHTKTISFVRSWCCGHDSQTNNYDRASTGITT